MGTMGFSPVKWATASRRCETPRISMPSMQRTSLRFFSGSITRFTPASSAEITIGSTPRTGRTAPSRESSPSAAVSRRASGLIAPAQANTPRAMGRSKAGPSFLRSAGARLTVSRSAGKEKWQLRSAARTRSRDSRTAASGRPTISKAGMPGARLTSVVTTNPSMPARPRLSTEASMAFPPPGAAAPFRNSPS